MTIAHFRLALSAPARSILRLVQVTEYAHLRVHAPVGGALVSRELADALTEAFPDSHAEGAYHELFGDEPPGWMVLPQAGERIVIETGPRGADLSLLIRVLGIAAPEALASEMHYTPKAPSPVAGERSHNLS